MRTEVGYAGGRGLHPTYANIQDHSESIRITYDPRVLSYRQLLELFWSGNHPFRKAYSRQYRSAILWQNEDQKALALATRPQGKGEIYTAIEPLDVFTLAEDYHQKYYLRNTPALFKEFHAIYPNEHDFMLSTAAARANGYLGGNGTPEGLAHDLPLLGLSPKAQKVLQDNKPRPSCGG